jgi:transposase
MIEMLDIRVDVKGSASSGRGRPCKITAWFTEHNLQVPESLSDTQWAQAAEQFPLSQRQSPEAEARTRAMAEAVLYKVRTGCGWADLPPGGPDPVATNVRAARWLTSGQWAAFIEALGSYTGSDPAKHRPLPPMTVTGALDLRKNAHRSTSTSMLGELSAIIPLKFSIG